MKFNRTNMSFEFDYSWHQYEKESPKISGKPDDTIFNKSDGEQVLYLLNYFNFNNITEFLKAEKMLKYNLPQFIRTQHEAEKWIIHNWANSELK